jgi:WD40 repeat protein
MPENPNQPREYDAVLGSQVSVPSGAAVLGGLEAVKLRLASPIVQKRIVALSETLKYGQPGLDLVIEYLRDETEEIRKTDYKLLIDNTHLPGVLKVLWTYNPICSNILGGHSDDVKAIAFSPDGKTLFSGDGIGTIKVWEGQSLEDIRTLKLHSNGICSLISSSDGKTTISASYDHTISVWNWQTGEEIHRLIEYPDEIAEIATHSKHPARVVSVATTRDGQTLVSGSKGKTIGVWNLKSGRKIHSFTLNGHYNHITEIALSPDGQTLASGGDSTDRTIKIWNLQTGTEIRTLQPRKGGEVTALCFTPDGQILVSGSYDNTVKVWNWQTGEEIHSLTGHKNWVISVALSLDGKLIVSGGWDGTVKLWDLQTGEEICTLGKSSRDYLNGIESVNISSDGKTIVGGDRNKKIRLWQV